MTRSQASGLVAVVAEKPSVARDLAAVLGATRRGEGCLVGDGHVVTWAIGHLVALAQPHEIRPEWKAWRREHLPILPSSWPLVVTDRVKEQFEAVAKVLRDPHVTEVICATDAGREGELIFRQLYEAAGCAKPVKRLWISSLTPEAIRDGFARLRPASEYDRLADAARGRSRADWLVGMNFSRAFTLAHDETLTVGRVQTPTLAMVVERELSIRAFVPEEYLEVVATFDVEAGRYRGTWFDPARKEEGGRRLPKDGAEAARVVERVLSGEAVVESVEAKTRRTPAPLLFDLTELQRHANRLLGWSAKKTLEVAQRLYEEKKAITYPRTDSRHLSRDVAATLPDVMRALAPAYGALFAAGTLERPIPPRFVDDARVTDHHAILPTPVSPRGLDAEEQALYDLVARRLVAAWHDEHVAATTTVVTAVTSGAGAGALVDRFRSTGTVTEQAGWRAVEPEPASRRKGKGEAGEGTKDGEPDDDASLPPGLARGTRPRVVEASAVERRTRPPKRFTDATLLTAMETAGRTLDEKELAEAMKENGLGTPATRAEILEGLIARGYLQRDGKVLVATDKGIRLIGLVPESVKSPALTGRWEAELARIQRGEARLPAFMASIEEYVREVVGEAGKPPAGSPGASPRPVPEGAPQALAAAASTRARPAPAAAGPASSGDLFAVERPARKPVSPERLGELLKDVFGHDAFRPYQEAVCRAVTAGKDALLVMPTGAGKSLCYQLPGLARAGTTLVVSPLIALMEDQVGKLRALGLAAERIHSGRDRAESRQVCRDYLDGKLDLLFIAPERLSVPGFPEMLAKRTPALVAVDEAHCISHWGHDFRPDYRLLGARLPALRPAPVIALTATATPRVQEDIAAQLGLIAPGRFIHGFRRTNLAVEVTEAPPSRRADLVREVLADPARLPAIVYTPTRREATELAKHLRPRPRAAAYHAGMGTKERDEVQRAFLEGRLDAIVATIAFGMGVDKPDVRTVVHTGLPGSVEGYYQEIGRAGRDGLPSRAILLQSYGDTRMHEHFLARDYPETSDLERVFARLGEDSLPSEDLASRSRLDPETFEKALEKLWIFGGAVVTPEGLASRGKPDWKRPYEEQREFRKTQLVLVRRFAEGASCRMLQLVRHFGDTADPGTACGVCDVCAPGEGLSTRTRRASPMEEAALRRALELLRWKDGQGTGQLHREVEKQFPAVDRRSFEDLLGGLARAGHVTIEDDEFEKDGKTIRFRRAFLTRAGRDPDAEVEARVAVPPPSAAGKKRAKARAPRAALPKPERTGRRRAEPAGGATRAARRAVRPAPPPLVEELRLFRLAEAKRQRVPAFRVFTDETLLAIATSRPRTEDDLLAIPGIGPARAARYGPALLRIVATVG
ncbi:DNA topoisomerase III [Acidobacteria bacterium ACD]|nr:DNA topoisomerase III [Acidobacteria bacterium ACD]